MLDHKNFTRFNDEFPANPMKFLVENCGARFDSARFRSKLLAANVFFFFLWLYSPL
jgi:hypothetical protein